MSTKDKINLEELCALDPNFKIKIDYSALVDVLIKIVKSVIEFENQQNINVQEFAELCVQELIDTSEADFYIIDNPDIVRH